MPASTYTAAPPRALSRLSNTSSPWSAHLQEQWLENEDIFDTPAVRALVGATVEPLRDHGIDTVALERRDGGIHELANLGRIEDILAGKPPRAVVLAGSELAFHQLHKARGRTPVHLDTRVEILDSARVGARAHRELGGKHAHLARARAVNRRAAPGTITPITGTSNVCCASASPAAVAVLQAMTITLTSCRASHSPTCRTNERTSSSERVP